MSSTGEAGEIFGGDAAGARASIDAARSDFDQAKAASAGEQLPLIPDGDAPELPDLAENDAYVSLPDAAEIVQLQMAMGNCSKAVFETGSITWRKSKDSVTLDTKRLLAEHPEYLENYGVSKPGSRRFVVQAPGRAVLGSDRFH